MYKRGNESTAEDTESIHTRAPYLKKQKSAVERRKRTKSRSLSPNDSSDTSIHFISPSIFLKYSTPKLHSRLPKQPKGNVGEINLDSRIRIKGRKSKSQAKKGRSRSKKEYIGEESKNVENIKSKERRENIHQFPDLFESKRRKVFNEENEGYIKLSVPSKLRNKENVSRTKPALNPKSNCGGRSLPKHPPHTKKPKNTKNTNTNTNNPFLWGNRFQFKPQLRRLTDFCAQNYYNIIGVTSSATSDDIKAGYRRKLIVTHPDKGGTQEDFLRLKRAFDVLNDPKYIYIYIYIIYIYRLRDIYDNHGKKGIEQYELCGCFFSTIEEFNEYMEDIK